MPLELPRDKQAYNQSRWWSLTASTCAITSGAINHFNFWRIISPVIAAGGDIAGKWANRVSIEREQNNTSPIPHQSIDLLSGFKEWASKHPVRLTYSFKLAATAPLFYSGLTQHKYSECTAAIAYAVRDILAMRESNISLKCSTILQGAAGMMIMSNYFASRGNLADLCTGFAVLVTATLTSRVNPEVYRGNKLGQLR